MKRRRAVVSWSSGKDSAWALHLARQRPDLEVAGLLVSINAAFQRVSMHGVRRELVERQAHAARLPLQMVELPWPCSNEEYEHRMGAACAQLRSQGVEVIVFGDIFLADVRAYRERQLAGTGIEPVFPVLGRDTGELVREMLAAGVRARIACLDPRRVPREMAGAELDEPLLGRMPADVDPCGENGEFHTFVTAAPGLERPVEALPGPVVLRDGFVFAELLPAGGEEGGEMEAGPDGPGSSRRRAGSGTEE